MEEINVSVRGIVFDIGGVLAWDIQEHLFSDETHGIPGVFGLDYQRTWPIAKHLWRRYAYERQPELHNWQQLERQYWTEFTRELGISTPVEDFVALSVDFVRPVDGMQELLERLRQKNLHTLICSNNTEFWFQRQRERLGLDQYIAPEDVVLSCRIGASKSSPSFELFNAVAQRMRFGRQEYLFVDNQFENVCRANEFGLVGIYFPTASPGGASYLRHLLIRLGVAFPQ